MLAKLRVLAPNFTREPPIHIDLLHVSPVVPASFPPGVQLTATLGVDASCVLPTCLIYPSSVSSVFTSYNKDHHSSSLVNLCIGCLLSLILADCFHLSDVRDPLASILPCYLTLATMYVNAVTSSMSCSPIIAFISSSAVFWFCFDLD